MKNNVRTLPNNCLIKGNGADEKGDKKKAIL